MGSLYRSEPMKLCQLILEKDIAYSCTGALGQIGLVHFKDLNPNTTVNQKNFTKRVRQCNDTEERLLYLQKEIKEASIEIPPIGSDEISVPHPRAISTLELIVAESVKRFQQLKESEAQLKKSLNEMCEYKHVLLKVNNFYEEHLDEEALIEMSEQDSSVLSNEEGLPLLSSDDTQCRLVAGVLDFKKKLAFERCMWRACYRYAFVRCAEIEPYFDDPFTGEKKKQCVFVVLFKGAKIAEILQRVCEGFKARKYPCPKTRKERRQAIFSTAARMDDLKFVISSTAAHHKHELTQTSLCLPRWMHDLYVLKSIYHTMNLFKDDSSGNFYVSECWIAETDIGEVRKTLEQAAEKAGSAVRPMVNILESEETPPTYNKTNKFTEIFQNIVDAYGVPTYREVNPAPFTIITFPFLFSIMFGDCGHGAILVLVGLFFVWKEKAFKSQKRDEILDTFFGGRYIILLMGLFSIYAGFVYNDLFSKSFNVFGSHWTIPYNASEVASWGQTGSVVLNPEIAFKHRDGPYFYGVDPIWNLARNRLTFLNSMKMKMSVIIGIVQMSFGVILSALNHSHFRSPVNFLTCFIPQMIFLLAIFGYLCVQIIVKWIFFWVEPNHIFGNFYPGSYCAPSLLVGLINMFLLKPKPEGFVKYVNATDGNQFYEELPACSLNKWYPDQAAIELALLAVAISCVPIMLLGKPIAFLCKQRGERKHTHEGDLAEGVQLLEVHPVDPKPSDSDNEKQIETFGDVFIEQAIHTIEFVLGCVSHTASYLRLWALSLAHQQLSDVLWEKTMTKAFEVNGFFAPVYLFVFFIVFTVLTVAALVMMEGLGAFLHTVRLHWVEFQSKFYEGLGCGFQPFDLRTMLHNI